MKALFKLSLVTFLVLFLATCQKDDEEVRNDGSQLKKAEVEELSVEGKYIVVFKDLVGNPQAEAENLKVKYGFKKGHVYEHCLKGFSAQIPPAALEGLKKNPHIDYIEQDKILSISAQTLPTGVRRIAVDTSPFADIDGDGGNIDVDVAVIDTGVDIDHPDLNVAGGVRYYLGFFTDSKYDDDHGHGSHVSGIIGAKDNDIGVVGMAPGARIWGVKVLNSKGSGFLSDIIKGIDWVKARASTIEVINMSLGGAGYDNSYRTAIANCVAAGIVVVVAAGNETSDVYGADGTLGTGDDIVPAAFPEAAAISALADSNGQPGGGGPSTSYGPDDSFATFSNFSRNVVTYNPVTSPGKAIDLLMPGVNIYSCYKGGQYATMSGTSMASPHAAGLAALYIAEHGRASNAAGVYAIRQTLIDRGKDQSDPEGLFVHNDPDPNKEKLGWVILSSPLPDQPPVARAGQDQTVNDDDGSGNETVNLDGSASTDDHGIATYSWKENGSEIASGVNPQNVTFTVGIHNVELEVTDNAGQTGTDVVVITVMANQQPSADFTYTPSGLTVNFANKSTDPDGTIISYSWDFGDSSPTSTDQNPSHTYGSGGDYSVTLVVTDNGGLTDSYNTSITVTQPVNQPPVAGFTQSITGLKVDFTDQSTDPDGTVAGWSWTFGDDKSSTTQSPSHTYAAAGTYPVSLQVTDNEGLSSTVVSKNITVYAAPAITLTVTGYKVKGLQKADLVWSGASSPNVDIYRNGTKIVTVASTPGNYTDNINNKGGGTYNYKVCEAGTTDVCSNEVTVVF